MRNLHVRGWDLADNLLGTFAQLGYWLEPGSRILDFGCGTGGLVYRLRDLGFEAYGFDIHERVDYRDADDRRFFGFIDNPTTDTSNALFSAERFRLPFDDGLFDAVVSTSVLEHVMDLAPVMAEIARVLKAGGISFHVYPKKSIVIEPHIYVPFGSRWQSRAYFRFWGMVGIRNQFQERMSAREVADNNLLYCRTGLKYLSQRELFELCAVHFDEVEFVERAYYYNYHAHPLGRWLQKARALRNPLPLRALAEMQRLGALLTVKGPNGSGTGQRPKWRGRGWRRLARRARRFFAR